MANSSLKLLFDEHFSHHHVKFLHEQSRLCEMQHLRALGWSGKPDVEWMSYATSSGFVIVSGARNEKTRGITVRDLSSLGSKVILLNRFFDHKSRWDKAKWLVTRIEKLAEIAGSLEPGLVVLVQRSGAHKRLSS